jgi:hypothetical protein
LAVALTACKGGGVNLVNTPSVGRADTCPDDAVAIDDRFGPGPSEVRCSYSDAIGQGVTTLSGQVRAEDGAIGVGMGDVVVSVHAASGPPNPDDPGPALASTVTDAQGSFHFSAVLDAGDYLLVAKDENAPGALAFRTLTLDAGTRRELSDLLIWVPADERLSSPSAPR